MLPDNAGKITSFSCYVMRSAIIVSMLWKCFTPPLYCMDATIKSGFEQGFHMIVPAYANSTYDNPYFSGETAYKYFNEFMWPKRYAQAVTIDEAIEMMKSVKQAEK